MAAFVSLLLGLLFGIGLLLSGMTDPGKVRGFLDVAGNWDPSLAFVMGGAITLAAIPFAWLSRRTTSWLGNVIVPVTKVRIEPALILGSALFGIGWGLAGFCPGPALVGLGEGYLPATLFVIGMIAGMGLFEATSDRFKSRFDPAAAAAALPDDNG